MTTLLYKADNLKKYQNLRSQFLWVHHHRKFPFLLLILMVIGLLGVSQTATAADLINGGHVSEGIDYAGDVDEYTFTASADDHIEIRMADTSDSENLYPHIELYGPSGGNCLIHNYNPHVAVIAYTITEGGTYTVLLKDTSSNHAAIGTYDLYYVKTPGANELGLLYDDETLSDIIDLGDLDTYTFIANVGETFDIEVTDISDTGTLRPWIQLYGPSGGSYLKHNIGNDVASISHTVTEIGTYTVLIKDASSHSAATGEYEIYCTTDGDNDIDGEDLAEFVVDYENMTTPYADKDGNGSINEDDIARFAREYGKE